ncbi:5-dehydro-4-deoxyglucarate dehydratase [Goodfellowiella coeruleoviolacea]|uniref:Probable 5-dehydro-4-deoxyglucarate dehydratase n=1 Tax=Goodfellowiella coeruleoviolacea TaxID=334858 RepID=A0AAE3GHP1_9PSEU|nr:5-dehydro-4-deoxyglucarate dehydratase [Goodfellowiella coeruleoviolacea]MCP2168355.1 5-dehydro-4-deoxyglucarate dehydratase [Goodfellowiella coeruleoviolacea]
MHLDGVLFFPVTPFDPTGALAEDVLAEHVDRGVAAGPGGVFVACGTGEFHALEPAEFERVVRVAVNTVAGRVPVFAGAGGALPLATTYARAAARAGADGLLLLPPYLVASPPQGLTRYIAAVAGATDLPVIVYQRNNAVFTPSSAVEVARLPTVVGLKDGLGDLDLLHRIVLAVRAEVDKPFQFFNGLPTAELTQPAYRGIGVDLYSSAVFCFAPEISLAFYRALRDGDTDLVTALLTTFYRPLVELRDRVPGYAVSLVKAGVRAGGLAVGGVRPPLVDPTEEHLAELARIVHAGRTLVEERS